MNNQKVKKLMYSAASRLPHSIIIAARILSDVKLQKILKKYGAGKPIIIIYGEPGNGKTSSVRTLLGEHREIKFVSGLKEIKKVVQSMSSTEEDVEGQPEKAVFVVDNFPKSLSVYKLETCRRILDYVVDIVSEDEKLPITIITGEMNLLEEIQKATSLQERALIVKMNKIDEDKELLGVRNFFSIHQKEYMKQWELYHQWDLKHPVQEADVSRKLSEFRRKYNGKYEMRQIGLVFCYFYAMYRFSLFLESLYGENIEMGKIEKNMKELFDWKNVVEKTKRCYEVEVWKDFLYNGDFPEIYKPRIGRCLSFKERRCENQYLYQCYACEYKGEIEEYNPVELMLKDAFSPVLVEKPKLIPYFPKHIVCDSPLLIIEKDTLIGMLNAYLEEYTRKNSVNIMAISARKFTKSMFKNNLLLFKYQGDKRGYEYIFDWKSLENKKLRVLFIKLTKEEYEILEQHWKNNYEVYGWMRDKCERYEEDDDDNDDVFTMDDVLYNFGKNVRSLMGEIGTPSKVFDESE